MMLLRSIIIPLFYFLLYGTSIVFTQIPEGYYNSVEGLKGVKLKAALNDIIDGHVQFPYTSTNIDVWDILKETDKDTIDPSKVILLYTGWTVDAAQEYNRGKGWTREHVWAKSRGGFGTRLGPGTDVHALRPCDVSVNSARSNRWFGCGDYEYIDGDGATGSYTSSSSWVWEPRDIVKGDVARMIFYMATRYYNEDGSWQTNDMVNGAQLKPWALQMLYQWHRMDTVSQKEIDRNNDIYNIQNNRNPYVDHPEWVDSVWQIGVTSENIDENFNISIYPNPSNGEIYINFSNSKLQEIKFSIYSVDGKLIKEITSKSSSIVKIDLDEKGFYVLKAFLNDYKIILNKKIIVYE